MGSVTGSISIAAPVGEVFAVVSDPERLPDWCTDFARASRRDGDHWTVDTPFGPVQVRSTADRDTGVVDFRVISEYGDHQAFTRLIPVSDTETEFVFTRLFGAGEGEAEAPQLLSVIEGRLKTLSTLF
ncbi:SRPBCC family protein [Streptomyces pseudovenezuelae]|uniref:SRPBCC family protein n=1 Tax=Streptomyces pseudovenezuelae TaxID=67350 RepID=A0ABZ1X1S8_9ACTN|nr:SRPBCC family protein [Streptomyces pseudovenezuelae]WUA88751.1 SRPBCC family protein [Streptomyces pseudovenezuelae]